MKSSLRILVICDQNLECAVKHIIEDPLVNVSLISWRRGSDKANHCIEAAWREGCSWDVVFSVYSDYIIPQYALNKIRIPLNIHPALPSYPGVGYDILPLLNKELVCGATLHWMDEEIDHGVVLETMSTPLPPNATHSILRRLNQISVLSLFERWFRLASDTSEAGFYKKLQVPILQGRGWTGSYTSQHLLRSILTDFQRKSPEEWRELQIPTDTLASAEGVNKICQSRS